MPVTLRREDGVWKIDDWEFVNAMTIDPAVVMPSDPAVTKASADRVPDVPPASMKIPEEPVSGTTAGREFNPDRVEYERSGPSVSFGRAAAGREPPKRMVYENTIVTMRRQGVFRGPPG